jgi:hypothetical protein
MGITVLWVMTSCSLVVNETSVVFLDYLEDGDRKFLRNLNNSLEKKHGFIPEDYNLPKLYFSSVCICIL